MMLKATIHLHGVDFITILESAEGISELTVVGGGKRFSTMAFWIAKRDESSKSGIFPASIS